MQLFKKRDSNLHQHHRLSPYSQQQQHDSLVSIGGDHNEGGDGDGEGDGEGGEKTAFDKEKWEFVIVYAAPVYKLETPEKSAVTAQIEEKREGIVKKLEDAGLIVSKRESMDHQHFFLLIRASEDRLEEQAEVLSLQLGLKDEFEGGSCPFTVEKRDLFKPTSTGSLFTKTQKQYLIYTIIIADKEDGGADLNLEQMQWDGIIEKSYPLHANRVKEELIADWVKKPLAKIPLEPLRTYFGEEIAFYFGWLSFYTRWLWAASVVGIIAMIIGASGIKNENKWSNSVYALFISVWVTLFLEYWKRQRNVLAWRWNMLNYEEVEAMRPSFRGEERLGVYAKKEFIELRKDEMYGLSPPKMTKFFPRDRLKMKMLTGFSIVVLLCSVVVIATLAILTLRIFVYRETNKNSTYASVVGGVMNAVAILVLNKLYRYVALRMNEWENHRTVSEFQDNLLAKIFLFQFVNSYTSLYYIAFFKRHTRLWGLEDTCSGTDTGDSSASSSSSSSSSSSDNPPMWGWGCPDELFVQLFTILATNIVVGQAQEIAIPWLTTKAKLLWYQFKTKRSEDNMPKYEREFQYNEFDGTFDEYSEMVIQYGYIVLFAASFPLAPLFAALNNLVEMRSDTWKWLRSYNKPIYRGADDIGGWYGILEVLGVIGVITNCCLIAFSFPTLHLSLKEPYTILCVVVLIEHAVLIAKYLIASAVPDVPQKVRVILAKQYYIQQQIMKRYEKRHGLHPGAHRTSTHNNARNNNNDTNVNASPDLNESANLDTNIHGNNDDGNANIVEPSHIVVT